MKSLGDFLLLGLALFAASWVAEHWQLKTFDTVVVGSLFSRIILDISVKLGWHKPIIPNRGSEEWPPPQ
jgi:hypothetical protein